MWPGVGSGSSRSHHLAMVEQGFEPEAGVGVGGAPRECCSPPSAVRVGGRAGLGALF